MRIAATGTLLSLAAFGIVSARAAEPGDVQCSGFPANQECLYEACKFHLFGGFLATFQAQTPRGDVAFAAGAENNGFIDDSTRNLDVLAKRPDMKVKPHAGDKPHPGDKPRGDKPRGGDKPHLPGKGGLPGLPGLPGLAGLPGKGGLPGLPHRPEKPKSPNSPSCTDQQIDCNFLRSTASRLQNEEDDCLRLAAGLDTQGKLRVEPLAQDNNNVVYGITIDGLTSSAWCTDIGWALRRILTTCRRGKTCYGGNAQAARNSVFMVAAGARFNPSLGKPGGLTLPKLGKPP